MRVRLDYGKHGLEVELPDDNVVGVLSFRGAEPLADPHPAIREALLNPIGKPPLVEAARGKRDACIVVCDVTRPVPNHQILPHILDALEAAGIPRDRVTILIATGTHRPNHGEELERMLGREIVETCRIENHICTDGTSVRLLGTSTNGVPVELNRVYLNADLKITVGMIEPHFMAGYAGGRKMVMPGIASLATVQAWHSPRFLEHPNATNGITRGNPVHEEALEIANMARPDFIVDVALDVQKRIAAVFAGDMEEAWQAGVDYVAGYTFDYVPHEVDIVVTTSGGHPLDLNFYQAVKGMVGALPIVRPGGTIVIAAELAEGVGQKHFLDTLLTTEDLAAFPETIQHPDWQPIGDQWQIEEFAKAYRHASISLVCDGVPAELANRLFVTPFPSVEAAIEDALHRHGPKASIAAIPKGPYVVPQVMRPAA